jgi:hypothetical protein
LLRVRERYAWLNDQECTTHCTESGAVLEQHLNLSLVNYQATVHIGLSALDVKFKEPASCCEKENSVGVGVELTSPTSIDKASPFSAAHDLKHGVLVMNILIPDAILFQQSCIEKGSQ